MDSHNRSANLTKLDLKGDALNHANMLRYFARNDLRSEAIPGPLLASYIVESSRKGENLNKVRALTNLSSTSNNISRLINKLSTFPASQKTARECEQKLNALKSKIDTIEDTKAKILATRSKKLIDTLNELLQQSTEDRRTVLLRELPKLLAAGANDLQQLTKEAKDLIAIHRNTETEINFIHKAAYDAMPITDRQDITPPRATPSLTSDDTTG